MTKSIGKENLNFCPECGAYTNYNLFRGEEACSHCGLVVNERIFSTSHDGKRTLFDNKKITPPITIRTSYNTNQKRIFKINTWAKSKSNQRNLNKAYSHISRICGNLKLPNSVKYETEYLYKKALKKRLTRRKSIVGVVCACIYHSSKTYYNTTIGEIAQQIEGLVNKSEETVKHVRSCYTLIVRELKLKYQSRDLLSIVPRYVSEAGLPKDIATLTIKFLEQCNAKSIFNGKDPKGVVAAAVYLIAKKNGYNITQSKIARIAHVRDVTVGSRMNTLQKLV